jgi:hypothetical protein
MNFSIIRHHLIIGYITVASQGLHGAVGHIFGHLAAEELDRICLKSLVIVAARLCVWCMCACMCVRACVCVHVCASVCVCVGGWVGGWVCPRARVPPRATAFHARTHARTHALTHARTHARTHTRTHAHTHTRTPRSIEAAVAYKRARPALMLAYPSPMKRWICPNSPSGLPNDMRSV